MLEPQGDPDNGVCHAPVHLKASGGLLVIDDLGRQQVPPRELLNRFIGPLDHGADLLTMAGGLVAPVPFTATLVLATSCLPSEILDEPLLRRIAYKIRLGGLGEAGYRALLRRECAAVGVAYDEGGADYLLGQLHGPSGRPLLPGYPHELLSRIADFASFAGHAARLTASALDQAWHSMFGGLAAPAAGSVLLGGKS
jgi:hypothetical protein